MPDTNEPRVTDAPNIADETDRSDDAERMRLNAVDSYYRGTPAGALYLYNLSKLSYLQSGEDETPQRKTQIEIYRPIYKEIAVDLDSFDRVSAFEAQFGADADRALDFALRLQTSETEQAGQGYAAGPLSGGPLLTRMVSVNGQDMRISTDPVNRWNEIISVVQMIDDGAAPDMVHLAALRGRKPPRKPGGEDGGDPTPPLFPLLEFLLRRKPRRESDSPAPTERDDRAVTGREADAERKSVAETLRTLTDQDAVSRAAPFDRRGIVEGAVAKIDALIGYVRDVVKPSNGQTSIPRFLFDLGKPSSNVLSRLRNVDADIADAAAQKMRLSNQVIDKTYRNNPDEADRLLSQLPKLLEHGEALRNKSDEPMRWLLVLPYETTTGSVKNEVAILEIARTKDAAEIVSIHVAPTEKLDQIKQDPWTR